MLKKSLTCFIWFLKYGFVILILIVWVSYHGSFYVTISKQCCGSALFICGSESGFSFDLDPIRPFTLIQMRVFLAPLWATAAPGWASKTPHLSTFHINADPDLASAYMRIRIRPPNTDNKNILMNASVIPCHVIIWSYFQAASPEVQLWQGDLQEVLRQAPP